MYQIRSHTFYLTNNCMLHCPYCYEKNARARNGLYVMSLEDIKAIIDNAVKITPEGPIEFSLFGGEPTFYLKQQVIPLLQYLKSFPDHHRFKVSMMTNGFNLTQDFVEAATGLDWYALISLDGEYDLVKDSMSRKAYERIIANINNVPLEVRRVRLGVKATVADNVAHLAKEIYQTLNALNTSVVYFSPVHEITYENMKIIVERLGEDIKQIRDSKMLRGEVGFGEGVQLFYKKGEIFLTGHTVRPPSSKPVGWFKNGKVTISQTLLSDILNQFPGLSEGKLYLTPKDSALCESCQFKDKICVPLKENLGCLAQGQCTWYKELEEKLWNIPED